MVAAASLLLETAQYALAVGSSDVPDLVVNTVGGVTGIGLHAAWARHRYQEATVAVLTRVCFAGTVLALLAVGLFVASPVRFAQPR